MAQISFPSYKMGFVGAETETVSGTPGRAGFLGGRVILLVDGHSAIAINLRQEHRRKSRADVEMVIMARGKGLWRPFSAMWRTPAHCHSLIARAKFQLGEKSQTRYSFYIAVWPMTG